MVYREWCRMSLILWKKKKKKELIYYWGVVQRMIKSKNGWMGKWDTSRFPYIKVLFSSFAESETLNNLYVICRDCDVLNWSTLWVCTLGM